MTENKTGFPEPRDRQLQKQAERLMDLVDDSVKWAGSHIAARQDSEFAIGSDEEFTLYRLRRLAQSLYRSSKTPVAAAVYGASQTGKSLFMGRVLEPADMRDSPLGISDQLDPDTYIRELSFNFDINPQCGSSEATALVTRFTTKDRFDETALPEYPVKVRALSRSEWLCVLARGFKSECKDPGFVWSEEELRKLFEETAKNFAGQAIDRDSWRIDLLDAFTYMKSVDRHTFPETPAKLNFFLSQFSLTEEGYIEIAGRLFWNKSQFPELTKLFKEVDQFRRMIVLGDTEENQRDGILVHWGAVRFLLDSQRSPKHISSQSRWKNEIAWSDFKGEIKDGWYVIDYKPGQGPPKEPLTIIQSAMLELILPIVPERLNEDWRNVIHKMDILDLPGMRADASGSEGAETLDTEDKLMFVVKRGKVFYLIDRYLEERQVQTLLLLVRGGNLEVRKQLREYVNKFGRGRYGEDRWPTRVSIPTRVPALFIGMTGIDDEFKDRDVNPMMFDVRLKSIADETLQQVMTDFGAPKQSFTNVYPIRYPGTWDCNEVRRTERGAVKWENAKKAFLDSEMVKRHVVAAEEKWTAAMHDNDGGLSLICRGFIECTSSNQKQDSLEQELMKVEQDLRALLQSWYCDPNVNRDREKRRAVGVKVLNWLEENDEEIYDRSHALLRSLCFESDETIEVAEFTERRAASVHGRPEPVDQRFQKFLKDYIGQWSREFTVRRWREQIQSDPEIRWMSEEEFQTFTAILADYLRCNEVFPALQDRLWAVVNMKVGANVDKRLAAREYVRLVLNDFVTNPGADIEPFEEYELPAERDFGLMKSLILRWRRRLIEALGRSSGEHTQIPAGNDLLQIIIEQL